MRILLLTFYYEPDLSAGSFRATALVKALVEQGGPALQVDVITTEPNRYHSFDPGAAAHRTAAAVNVRRIRLPAHRSDMRGQARSFMTFARQALRAAAPHRYDAVVATSSRLMTAALGAKIARRIGAPLYLDIRDIFVDTMADVLPRPAAWALGPALTLLERWTMQQASRINLVSAGFAGYFSARYPTRPLSFHTNGIDDEFLEVHDAVAADPAAAGVQPVEVLYAGNIGEGQGLHLILPQLAAQLRSRARFTVIGDGGRRQALVDSLKLAGATDLVRIVPPVSRAGLLQAYRRADVLFLHLNAHRAFLKVLPSKVFEYGALGKPVLAGVAGYAADFIRDEVRNAEVFTPCDAPAGARAFARLELALTDRAEFRAKFARQRIMQAMAQDVLEMTGRGSRR